MAKIIKDGFFFRATADNFTSHVVTSPSQAGLIIARKFGKAAYAAAVNDFLGR